MLIELLNILNSATLTVSPQISDHLRSSYISNHLNAVFQRISSCLQVPDELTERILKEAGVGSTDVRTVRLVSLAAQKFLSDIVEAAKVVQENRMQAPQKHQQAEGLFSRDKKAALITEDLTAALQQVR